MIPGLFAVIGLLAGGWLVHSTLMRRRLQVARRDPVTGLLARHGWTERARRILRSGGNLVALVDLDRFKEVNDTFGHAAGDRVLAVTAARLQAWLDGAGGGECGRLGGDEFALAVRQPITGPQLDGLASLLATPVRLASGENAQPGASIGAAWCRPGHPGLSAALAAADIAMYAAKRAGGGWRAATSARDCAQMPDRSRAGRRAGCCSAEVMTEREAGA
jgi:diguanylate cyclase (GGDEF)-like protein